MIPYCRRFFQDSELEKLLRAMQLVDAIPDEMSEGLRCHELARALGVVLGLKVRDGKYGPVEHSWLLTEGKDGDHNILDPYVPAHIPQVQLREMNVAFISHPYSYYPTARTDIQQDVVDQLVAIFREVPDEVPRTS